MLVVIGSLRKPKIDAVKEAFKTSPYFKDNIDTTKFVAQQTKSDISEMPLNIDEIMRGAKNRVRNLKKEIKNADFYIGLEGGTSKIGDIYFLFGATYIENKNGKGHYGFSPMIEIPDNITQELYQNKANLGELIERYSNKKDIRSNNGTLGELSDDMIKRTESFTIATQAAIAPFFNKYWK